MSSDAEGNIEKELGLTASLGQAGLVDFAIKLSSTFGGAVGVAKKFREIWDNPETSQAVRNQMMVFLIKTTSEAAEAVAKTDYKTMTREQLVAKAKELFQKNNWTLPYQWADHGQS